MRFLIQESETTRTSRMDSLIYPGTDKLWPKRVADPPRPSAFVDLTSQNELYQRNQKTCDYEPRPSSLSKGEMNLKDVPVVDNSFSLPQNVFEKVLASQTRVSITSPSSPKGFVSPFVNYSAAHGSTAGQQQRRRTSGDDVTEFTGSEAKRPRLSPPITSEQDLAQRRHNKKLQREQFKLQILRRLDNTKNNILKLLKLQHMQNLTHYYENDPLSNQAGRSGSSQGSELRFHSQQGSAYERQYQTPTLAPVQNDPRPVSAQGTSRPSHLPSTSYSFRGVPGISVVTNGDQSNEQKTRYSYKSSDSVGLAWDHKTLPKIVAVHSVINDRNVSGTKTVNHPTLGAATAAQEKRSSAVGRAEYVYEKSEGRQNHLQSPVMSLTSEVNNRGTAVTNRKYRHHEDIEVVVTNVLPGRPRCSISTEQQCIKTKSNHNERSVDEKESSPNDLQVNRRNFARFVLDTSYENMEIGDHLGHVRYSLLTENTAHAEQSRHFNHPGHSERSRHVDYPGHVEHLGHADHTGHSDHTRHGDLEVVEQVNLTNGHANTVMANQGVSAGVSQTGTVGSQNHVHPGFLQSPEHADSEVYLGGPPPYLPVLDSSEMAEREKQRRSPPETGELRGSNPTSPRLTKTIPEIREKLTETRERMKNETIEWKKKILYSLEKRLIKKLRRAESATGQKTDIEDLQEGGAGKGKKGGNPNHDRRSSGEGSVTDSVTDSVMDDDDDTLEHSDNLPEETENVEKSDDRLRKCPQEDKKGKDPVIEIKDNCEDESAEKCQENKQVEIPCPEEEKMVQWEISTKVINEQKVEECSKRFHNGFEESLNADEEESNVELDESIVIVDCVTNEHCEEIKFHGEKEKTGGSETYCTVSVNVSQRGETKTHTSTEVSESSREKSRQESSDIKKGCATFAGNPNEKPKVETKNLFEVFSSGFHLPALKKDKSQLLENTEQMSPITMQEMSSTPPETKKKEEPAETRKPAQKNEKLLTNLSSLKKRLQTCRREVIKKKSETVSCDRNIWSVLKRDGIS